MTVTYEQLRIAALELIGFAGHSEFCGWHEKKPCSCGYTETYNIICEAQKSIFTPDVKAEPVQEPVAKVELVMTGGIAGLATRIVEIDDHLRDRLRPGQPLYTHPPQRKPLTDDAYRQLMKHAHRLANDGHGELAQYLRDAIDIAHGIGSKDE